jgi:integrase
MKPTLKVLPYRHHPKYKFVVDLRAFNKGRKFFKTRAEAEAEAFRQRTLLERHSCALIGLSQREMSEIIEAKQKLAEYGETITDAVKHRVDYLERVRRCNVTVAQLANEVIEAKHKDGRSSSYVYDLGLKLRRFCRAFGDRPVAAVTVEEIDKWLRDLDYSPKSRADFRANVGVLFSHAERLGIIDRNPVLRTSRPKLIDAPPEIFTVQELRSLLEAATRVAPDVVPMLAIGAFAGVRDAEIKRLDWHEIDLARGHIEIKAAKAKSARRRIILIQPNLAAWLRPYSGLAGRVVPAGARKKLDRVREGSGLAKWPNNGLRHCFASYRLAAIHDAPRVAMELGHTSPLMLFSTYREVVRPEEAESYWKIGPAVEAEKVVEFRKTGP